MEVLKRSIFKGPGRRPAIFRPPGPVEVKKARRRAFVQMPLLEYNQGELPAAVEPMKSSMRGNRVPVSVRGLSGDWQSYCDGVEECYQGSFNSVER